MKEREQGTILILMDRPMKKSDYYVAEAGRPVSLSELPYTLDIRAAVAYAKAKGVAVSALSDAEKQLFLAANGAFLSAAAAN